MSAANSATPVPAEDPTHVLPRKGPGHDAAETPYPAAGIRFTASKDGRFLYAICLDVPTSSVHIHSLNAPHVTDVSPPGSQPKIDWRQDADGLVIQPANSWPTKYAAAFKLTLNAEYP